MQYLEQVIGNLSPSDILASAALVISLTSLLWNIARDFILDRVSITMSVEFGELLRVSTDGQPVFAAAGNVLPNHFFDKIVFCVRIVNSGRRDVVVASVGGDYRSGNSFSLILEKLPKTITPYGFFYSFSENYESLLEGIKKDEIKHLFAVDTKGKRWYLNRKGWKQLKKTALYIIDGKNISRK